MTDPEPSPLRRVELLSVKLPRVSPSLLGRIAAILVAIGVTVGIIMLRGHIRRFAVYGYPGVFLISLLGNATLILPAPSFAVVFAVGGALNPLGVGIAAGLGAALGEMTGYLAGVGGRTVIEDRPLYHRLADWMRRAGMLAVFLLALIPNPAFDVGGMMAGALGMPVWRFLLAGWAGKSARFILLAFSGQLLLGS
jgi:membrane protein YqaA with SNARE-associated domain